MLKTSLFFTAFFYHLVATGIYNFQTPAIDGSTINLNDFQGKKILFVNTADNSPYVNQYASLEQLYQLYKDSLVIIAFPSNSFGNETDSSNVIANFVDSAYNIHYLLATPVFVANTDSMQSPIYQWLGNASENGLSNNPVYGDFYKYLVDAKGNYLGEFSNLVDPMDSVLQNAIKGNY